MNVLHNIPRSIKSFREAVILLKGATRDGGRDSLRNTRNELVTLMS